MNETILCLEDEKDLLELLEYNLSKAGYEVILAQDINKAKKIIENEDISLLLADRNINGEDSLKFVTKCIAMGYDIPTIFLSAKDMPQDKLDGLNAGCDDYITKPFNFDELLARIKAVLKRYKQISQNVIRYKDLVLFQDSHELKINKLKISLTPLESKLMLYFIKNRGLVLSRDFLLENVWDGKEDVKENVINVTIKRLREKLKNHIEIKSIRSEGYRFC